MMYDMYIKPTHYAYGTMYNVHMYMDILKFNFLKWATIIPFQIIN